MITDNGEVYCWGTECKSVEDLLKNITFTTEPHKMIELSAETVGN